MASKCRLSVYLFLSVLLTGCATDDQMVKRQSEAEAKIEFLIQSSKKIELRHNELDGLLQVYGERLQGVTGEIKQLKDENRDLRTSRDELAAKVAGLVQRAQTPKVEIVYPNSPPRTTGESGPPAEYITSFGLYSANNFAAAIESFAAFLKNNPSSGYAANAQYWIGECHYSLSDLVKAREAFLKVTELYPKSSKAPDALLKLGYTLSALGEKEKAALVYEKIITAYPSHPVAKKARERLNAH